VGIAHPLATIDDPAAQGRFAEIADLVAEWKPARLVVGLPLALDGTPHELTRRAQRFARQLEGRFGLAVTLVDERLTSAEAEERLRTLGRRGPADKDLAHPLAAQVILQDFFDRHAAA
jgi:putative Holliday junction resolvase